MRIRIRNTADQAACEMTMKESKNYKFYELGADEEVDDGCEVDLLHVHPPWRGQSSPRHL
jgi:hypothetical protein